MNAHMRRMAHLLKAIERLDLPEPDYDPLQEHKTVRRTVRNRTINLYGKPDDIDWDCISMMRTSTK
jgi:hypothetical protein